MVVFLLYQDIQQFIPLPRLVELSNADMASNAGALGVAGTCTITNGSAAVTGSGTNFISTPPGPALAVGNVISFSSQPGVNYTVLAINGATSLTLAVPYTGTSSSSATAMCAGINQSALLIACNWAATHFSAKTNIAWDNTTVTDFTATPPTYNRCTWAGAQLVICYFMIMKGGDDADKALARADKICDLALRTWGDGAWAPPQGDGQWLVPYGLCVEPVFADNRFGTLIPWGPSPGLGNGSNGWGGVPSEYGG